MKLINPKVFLNLLIKNKVDFFCGVPDSILKNLTNCIGNGTNHVISANEGNAIAIAAGFHLATRKIGLVYMQNSGLGNAINPLTSLVNQKTYSIPMLLLIGWRGEGGNDEPQHLLPGEILEDQLKLLKIKYIILKNNKNYKSNVEKLLKFSLKNNSTVAILVKKNTFKEINKIQEINKNKISRSFAIDCILENLNKNDLIFSSTGKISREIMKSKFYEKNKNNFFFKVGAMGHTASLAFGMSLKTKKRVICIDGDGSFLMHLGSIPIITKNKKNFRYILLNNGAHESVGGQKTVALDLNLLKLSKSLGFNVQFSTQDPNYLRTNIKKILDVNKNLFFEIKINLANSGELPRPKNLKFLKKKFYNK